MSTDPAKHPVNRQIVDEAAAWFVEINEAEPDRATRERFDEWLRRSPEHARAYLRILPVWEEGAQLDTNANGDPKALIAWARAGSTVVPLAVARDDIEPTTPSAALRKAAPRSNRRIVALAASILCCAIGLAAWRLVEQRNLYETGIGEQRLLALSDGSRIELNSRSKVRVTFNEGERGIELVAGQALFRVAKEARRPFVVRSSDVVVRALGTQFDVYRKPTGTVVTVVEGRVAVASRIARTSTAAKPASTIPDRAVVLSAGEQTLVMPKALPQSAVAANVAAATAWTQQRLEFSMTPLAEVAEEFNRYNERQLVLKAGQLKNFNVTGTFSSTDPTSLLRFLQAQEGVAIEESDKEILISHD